MNYYQIESLIDAIKDIRVELSNLALSVDLATTEFKNIKEEIKEQKEIMGEIRKEFSAQKYCPGNVGYIEAKKDYERLNNLSENKE